MNKASPRLVLFLLVVACAVQIAWASTVLPATVTSHFDASGNPNGWMSRETFLFTYAVMVLVAIVPCALMGGLVDLVPERFINLPNKAYWLDPVRRGETIAYLKGWSLWFCDVVLAFLLGVMQLAIGANVGPHHRLSPSIWGLLGLVVLVTTGMSVALMARFGRKDV